jgi:hypothetical protein
LVVKEDGVASALFAKAREWIAGLGAMGCVIAIVTLVGITRTSSTQAIIGFCLSGLGIASAVIGFRNRRVLGWLLAVASIGLAIAAFVFAGSAPRHAISGS